MYRWILSLLAFFFWCGESLAEPPSGTLYFLNEPESVCKPGTVARQPLLRKGRARIFFHFRNCTGKAQVFTLAVNKTVNKTANGTESKAGEALEIMEARQVRAAFAVDGEPEQAGIRAAHAFMTQNPAKGGISLRVRVEPLQTVSGIAEGTCDEEGVILAQMGEGDVVRGMKVVANAWIFESFERKMGSSASWKLRLGEDREGRIAGDYGSTLRVGVENVSGKTSRLRIVVSPRGGDLALAYRDQHRVLRTPMLAARSRRELLSRVLRPGEKFSLDLIPAGGFNYPVEFRLLLDPLAPAPGPMTEQTKARMAKKTGGARAST